MRMHACAPHPTYDRDLDDLFAVQDDITREIAVEMQVQLTEGEQARVRQRSTSSLRAWGYAAEGLTLFERYTPADKRPRGSSSNARLKRTPVTPGDGPCTAGRIK